MKEFIAVFQMSKKVIFNVAYYTLSTNSHPHFTTSAAMFNQPKTDYCQCGQCQEELLKGHLLAFYRKWDKHHLKDLAEEEYREMKKDLHFLMERYNYIYEELDETQKPYSPNFSFYRLKEFSKQNPVKKGGK